MKVIEFLNSSTRLGRSAAKALIDLQERYGVKHKLHEPTGLYVLNYCQIESSKYKTDKIVRECRSLVLKVCEADTFDYFGVVSRSFDRFFNHGEHRIPCKIDKLNFYEKMDGSLVTLFHYKGEWMYRTKSMIMPEEDMKVNGFEVSWKELIEEALGYGWEDAQRSTKYSYILELTAPENRVVTRYTERSAVLLAVRRTCDGVYSGQHLVDNIAQMNCWKRPRTYYFNDWTTVEEGAKLLPNLEEGFVGYRNGEPMVKIKNPAYVAAHHLRGDGLNPKRCMDLVLMNETDEYLTVFPEDVNMLSPYIECWDRAMVGVDAFWKAFGKLSDQKDFALKVKDAIVAPLLFRMRNGKTKEEAINSLTTNAKYNIIAQYVEAEEQPLKLR